MILQIFFFVYTNQYYVTSFSFFFLKGPHFFNKQKIWTDMDSKQVHEKMLHSVSY